MFVSVIIDIAITRPLRFDQRGKMAEINFTMPDVMHTFRKGHRIMVQVQSSWFPLTDRNPQVFTDIPFAKPEDFKPATEEVFHQNNAASGVEVLVLPEN